MLAPQSRRFDTRTEHFEDVRGFVESFCAAASASARATARLLLVIEELFVNTVGHGYAGVGDDDAKWPVWLTLTVVGERIEAVYEDAAAAYDPFARVVEPDYSGPVEDWRIGGWGIPLVTKLTDDLRYERVGERNRIHFAVAPAIPDA